MLAYAHLAANYHIVFYHNASGKSCLRRDDHVFANLAVVANVHKIVYFCASADARSLQCSAVDCSIRADLDVVFNLQLSDLGEFFMTSRCHVTDISEAIAAKNGARMDDHAIANTRAGIDRHVRMNLAILSDRHVRAQHASRANPRSVANVDIFFQDHARIE